MRRGLDVSDWLAVLRVRRHAHRGELAGDLVRGGVQILQLPQVQTAAADQPRSQVHHVCRWSVRRFKFLVCTPRGCFCHTCPHMSVTGRKSCFFSRQPCTSSLSRATGFPSATSHTLNLVIVTRRLDSEGIELLLSFLKVSFATPILPASPTFIMLHYFLQVALTMSLVDIMIYMLSCFNCIT